jgi:hypothetical protein
MRHVLVPSEAVSTGGQRRMQPTWPLRVSRLRSGCVCLRLTSCERANFQLFFHHQTASDGLPTVWARSFAVTMQRALWPYGFPLFTAAFDSSICTTICSHTNLRGGRVSKHKEFFEQAVLTTAGCSTSSCKNVAATGNLAATQPPDTRSLPRRGGHFSHAPVGMLRCRWRGYLGCCAADIGC